MGKEFVIRVRHNATDDRWTYTIDGIADYGMMYPRFIGGVDDFGISQEGPWNENTNGMLDDLLGCVTDEIWRVFDNSDSFYYENGKEVPDVR